MKTRSRPESVKSAPGGTREVDQSAADAAAAAKAEGCSHMKLRRLMRLVSRHYDSHLAHCGLKTTQYSLLMAVAAAGPLRQSELARMLSLEASTLTRNLRPLVAAGLLDIGTGADGRSRQVCITPAGLALRARARRQWRLAQESFNRIVGGARVAALHDLADTCRQLLASEARSTAGAEGGSDDH